MHDVDRLGAEIAFHKDVPTPGGCRALCQLHTGCEWFAYFTENYWGDSSEGCVSPLAIQAWWATRCLLKTWPTAAEGTDWFVPSGNVIYGTRSCGPFMPWHTPRSSDAALATDGNYRRESCAQQSPWRTDLNAEYLVKGMLLFFGDLGSLTDRRPRRYAVELVTVDLSRGSRREKRVSCGTAIEPRSGGPASIECGVNGTAATAVIISSMMGEGSAPDNFMEEDPGFSLCEVELTLEPIPCEELLPDFIVIHSLAARMFPAGAARRALPGEIQSETCERLGGGLVHVAARGDVLTCIEAACEPTECLETFDNHAEAFAQFSVFGVWAAQAEAAAEGCGPEVAPGGGRLFEATVIVYRGGRPEDGGTTITTHWGFCAPPSCSDDSAATVAARLAAATGMVPEELPEGSEMELRSVRPLGRWEDVDVDFLIAGFARSGTHTVRGNLMEHPEVQIASQELTFNWGNVPLVMQLRDYHSSFPPGERLLRGGKGEGVALSPRILQHLTKVPRMKLVIIIREPVEWIESLYNLRAYECFLREEECSHLPSLHDVILNGASFEDVKLEDAFLSRSVEHAVKLFPPESGRLLLLEFELLRSRPREFFDRLTGFLGISPFPANFTFGQHASEDRAKYKALGRHANLCEPGLAEALKALTEQFSRSQEHHRLVQLLAKSGAAWVSSRLVLNKTHCS